MRQSKFEIYRDAKKEYRWRLRNANGKITADSGEGYERKNAAARAARRHQVSVYTAVIVFIEPKVK